MEQLLTALRFYATGSMQCLLGDAASISQPSVSRIVTEVTDALVNVAPQFIKMPRGNEVRVVRLHYIYI